jgi:hypothetical protein
MSDYDRSKINELLEKEGMDEEYFVENLKKMIDKGGLNLGKGLQMLGELKGLGKKNEVSSIGNPLLAFGQGRLANRVQDNRRIEEVTTFEILEDK